MRQFTRGDRVRIAKNVNLDHFAGFEGTVDQQVQSGVIVILDSDPATNHRVSPFDTFQPLNRPVIRRFFQLNEVEKIND